MRERCIAVFTGSRAEYGLLFPILSAIDSHPKLDYSLIVSGSHLDKNFGLTKSEIIRDGFHIDSEIKIKSKADSLFSTTQAIGSGIKKISKALSKIKPDILLAYGDRFESFAAVIAASQMNIPTAHVEGGDLTEGGALDDSVRHAMTKLSHIHFTTNKQSTNHLVAMGEEKWRINTVGLPIIDLVMERNYASREEILNRFSLDFSNPIIVFTQHPVSTQIESIRLQFTQSLKALQLLANEGIQVIITYPNNDAGGKQIIEMIKDFESKDFQNIFVTNSLGRYLYHGILALSQNRRVKIACVGNSSSGIKETPAFACPSVNIGSRQAGRLRGNNVLDSDYSTDEIYRKTKKALFDEKFRTICRQGVNPYYLGGAGSKIAQTLSSLHVNSDLLQKKFTTKN